MDDNDVFIEDEFAEDAVVEEVEQPSEEPSVPTLEDLLPRNCIVLSMEGDSVDPLISVRGRYRDDLGEAVSFTRLALSKLQYIKYLKERS